MENVNFSLVEIREIGHALGVQWNRFSLEQFWMGIELEHVREDADLATEARPRDHLVTGKRVLENLELAPDHYFRLERNSGR